MANIWLPGDSQVATALREPNLLVPKKQPIGLVKVNKSNPITKNLRYADLLGRTPAPLTNGSAGPKKLRPIVGQDLADKIYNYDANNQQEPGINKFGPMWKTTHTTGSSTLRTASNPSWFNNLSDCSFIYGGKHAGGEGANYLLISNSGTSGFQFVIDNATSTTYRLYVVHRGQWNISGATNINCNHSDEMVVCGVTFSGGATSRTFGQGNFVHTKTGAAFIPDSYISYYIHAQYGSCALESAFFYIWDRTLSDEEMRQIYLDPYQLFESANQTPYLFSVPAGGGAAQTIFPDSYAAPVTFGAPSVTAGAATISVDGYAAPATFGAPSVTAGAATISVDGYAAPVTFGAPSVTAGAATISVDGYAAPVTFGAPSVTAGAATISVDGYAAPATFGAPSVTAGAATISVDGYAAPATFGAPSGTVFKLPQALPITNPGGEQVVGIGWDQSIGSVAIRAGSPLPHSGSGYFYGGDGLAASQASQQLDLITEIGASPSRIDSGEFEIELNWWQASFDGFDTAKMGLLFLDSGESALGTVDWAASETVTPGQTWVQRTHYVDVPVTARYVRIYMRMDRVNGSNNDGYIDDITAFVTAQTQAISPTGYLSSATFGEPTLAGGGTIVPAGYAAPVTFGEPTLSGGASNISVDGYAAPVTFGAPSVTAGAATISVDGYAAPVTFGAPSVTAGAATISVDGYAAPVTFGEPAVENGLVITTDGLAVPVTFGEPTLSGGTAVLYPTGLVVAVGFGNSLVESPAGQNITVSGYNATVGFGSTALSEGLFVSASRDIVIRPSNRKITILR